jgi:hypothetical protein
MLTPEATEAPIPLTGEVRPKRDRPRKQARGPLWTTLAGRDRPESYDRRVDNAAIYAKHRLRTL